APSSTRSPTTSCTWWCPVWCSTRCTRRAVTAGWGWPSSPCSSVPPPSVTPDSPSNGSTSPSAGAVHDPSGPPAHAVVREDVRRPVHRHPPGRAHHQPELRLRRLLLLDRRI